MVIRIRFKPDNKDRILTSCDDLRTVDCYGSNVDIETSIASFFKCLSEIHPDWTSMFDLLKGIKIVKGNDELEFESLIEEKNKIKDICKHIPCNNKALTISIYCAGHFVGVT